MKQKPNSRRRRNSNKSILRLPDLEHAKAAVLNSLTQWTQSGVIVTPSMSSLTAKDGVRLPLDGLGPVGSVLG